MCVYCKEGQSVHDFDFELRITDYFIQTRHRCSECNEESVYSVLINYCPMCGKRLGE